MRRESVKLRAMKSLLPLLLLLAACGAGDRTDGGARDDDGDRFVASTTAGERCVSDVQNGLMWEVKSDAPGLHHKDHTYSWFDPAEAVGELDYRGLADGGKCTDSRCDTSGFVAAVNAAGYCGHSDWRMPTRDELGSLSDLRRRKPPPTIDTRMFPHAAAAEYWSGNDYSFQYDAAWCWNFSLGHDRVDWKKSAKRVRLVRSLDAANE